MVSHNDFLKIQDIISGGKFNTQKEYSKSKISPDSPLTDFVKCSCGTPLTSYPVKQKSLHYYKCQKCKDASFNAHTTKKLAHKGLDNLFEELLLKYSINGIMMKPFRLQLEKTFDDMNKEGFDELEAAKGQLTSVKSKLKKLETLYVENPDFEHEIYNTIKKKYKAELEARTEQIENAQKKISNHKKHIDKILDTAQNISKIWASGNIENKIRVQKLVFPEGLSISPKNRQYLTCKTNAIFAMASGLQGIANKMKMKNPPMMMGLV